MEKNSNEDTNKHVLNVVNNDLQIDMAKVTIDRTITSVKKTQKKSRLVIAKFIRYYDRKEVFSKKEHFKGKSISLLLKI